MRVSGNSILITGGGSGIGRALAHEFHVLGNRVIVAGRNETALQAVVAEHPGMAYLRFDIAKTNTIRDFAAKALREHPQLNVLINNAGIMVPEDLVNDADFGVVDTTIATNLVGPIHLTLELLPALLTRNYAAVMTVSSGLAFLPMVTTPTYCATKAAIHSYSQSLRYQLKDTPVEVLELVPPYVQTGLMGEAQENDPRAMPLAEFIAEAMTILKTQPKVEEILVERVSPLRLAGVGGPEKYEQTFRGFNDAMTAHARA